MGNRKSWDVAAALAVCAAVGLPLASVDLEYRQHPSEPSVLHAPDASDALYDVDPSFRVLTFEEVVSGGFRICSACLESSGRFSRSLSAVRSALDTLEALSHPARASIPELGRRLALFRAFSSVEPSPLSSSLHLWLESAERRCQDLVEGFVLSHRAEFTDALFTHLSEEVAPPGFGQLHSDELDSLLESFAVSSRRLLSQDSRFVLFRDYGLMTGGYTVGRLVRMLYSWDAKTSLLMVPAAFLVYNLSDFVVLDTPLSPSQFATVATLISDGGVYEDLAAAVEAALKL